MQQQKKMRKSADTEQKYERSFTCKQLFTLSHYAGLSPLSQFVLVFLYSSSHFLTILEIESISLM